MLFFTKKRVVLSSLFLVFGLIFCVISLVNHYNFRTAGWDLGIYNNAMFDYAHLRWNDCMIMQPQFSNLLSDHFEPIVILFSPIYFIFGSYTLLLVQVIFILMGGYGFYLLALYKTSNPTLSAILLAYFFSIWGIYSALSFDYHNNVIGAMLVPWSIYYFEKKNWKLTAILLLLIICCKENMALWAFFIGIGLIILNRKNKEKAIAASIYSIIGIVSFILIIKIIMPSMANEGREYLHFQFNALGNNMGGAIKTIVTKPGYVCKLLFENHLNNPIADGIKLELHLMVLLSGGIFLIFRPAFLIMLLPIYGQKLFNDDFGKWGLNGQYSIEFVPILALAVLYVLADIENKTNSIKIAITIATMSLIGNIKSIDKRVSKWYNSDATRFYSPKHYKRGFDVASVHHDINTLIPKNINLSAQWMLLPHLAFRNKIYQFPVVNDADYIVLLDIKEPYPLNDSTYSVALTMLATDSNWIQIKTKAPLFIFKRIERK